MRTRICKKTTDLENKKVGFNRRILYTHVLLKSPFSVVGPDYVCVPTWGPGRKESHDDRVVSHIVLWFFRVVFVKKQQQQPIGLCFLDIRILRILKGVLRQPEPLHFECE